MTSVERVIEYGNLPSEAPFESSAGVKQPTILDFHLYVRLYLLVDKKPSPDWPSEGSVKFEEMSLRYSETDPPVLKCITCQIKPKEKVNIKFVIIWTLHSSTCFGGLFHRLALSAERERESLPSSPLFSA